MGNSAEQCDTAGRKIETVKHVRGVPKMSTESPQAENYYVTLPYQTAFDIAYPQENLEGQMYLYRCKSCKKLTTDINGRLENHADDCAYRLQQMGRSA
jgi:DNA-directed RNA polymerase subunit RPC12/RpoP